MGNLKTVMGLFSKVWTGYENTTTKGQREGAFMRTQRQRGLGGSLLEAVDLNSWDAACLVGLSRRELEE